MKLKSNNFFLKNIFYFLYLSFFIVGLFIFNDFGISIDEEFQRYSGFYWLNYVLEFTPFESLKLISQWAGHYAMNTVDQNAIIGPHNIIKNFFFLNGFSGHGTQQAPAMGRATAELLIYDTFKTIDMSALKYERLLSGDKVIEDAII